MGILLGVSIATKLIRYYGCSFKACMEHNMINIFTVTPLNITLHKTLMISLLSSIFMLALLVLPVH